MELKKSLLTIDDADNLHLCFELDDKIYAINAKNVLEITALPMINDPQRLPEFIVGILNYNDMFINIADIRKILSLPKKNPNAKSPPIRYPFGLQNIPLPYLEW